MGLGAARIGDIGSGTCTGHDPPQAAQGPIITGAGAVLVNNLGIARIGDVVIHTGTPHAGILISGSATVISEGLGTCRIGSVFSGTFSGTIINGSSNCFVGD